MLVRLLIFFLSILISPNALALASIHPFIAVATGGDYIKTNFDQTNRAWVGAAFLGAELILTPYLSTQINLGYFSSQNKRLMIEGKLLANYHSYFLMHPYLLFGAGNAFDHTFAYEGGIGLEVEFSDHFRFGESYRRVIIENCCSNTRINEFLFGISYVI